MVIGRMSRTNFRSLNSGFRKSSQLPGTFSAEMSANDKALKSISERRWPQRSVSQPPG